MNENFLKAFTYLCKSFLNYGINVPSHQPNTPELPLLASHCSGTSLFSLSKYKKEDETVECLDKWIKQVSWVLGLGF